MKIKIWTVNRAAYLLETPAVRMQIRDAMIRSSNGGVEDVVFAQRKADDPIDIPEDLFIARRVDGLTQAEYFAPIVVKCLGSRLFDHGFPEDSEEARLFVRLREYYGIPDRAALARFWDPGVDNARMWTIPQQRSGSDGSKTTYYPGYYDLFASEPEYQHVIAGFSQGGLVARFLAYLDECVFRTEHIAGFLTLGSPNFGSPFGARRNAENISDGLLECLFAGSGLLCYEDSSLETYRNPHFAALLREWQDVATYAGVRRILERIEDGFEKMRDDQNLSQSERDAAVVAQDLFATAARWMGGLNEEQHNAFFDLNICRLRDSDSVAALVYAHPPERIYYGAIVNSNGNVLDLFESLLPLPLRLAFHWLSGFPLLGRELRDNLKTAGDIFTRRLMQERDAPREGDPPAMCDAIRMHRDGASMEDQARLALDRRFPPRAHDFVIPTAYQVIPPPEAGAKAPNFLGNRLNDAANHNSGSLMQYAAGRRTKDMVAELLAEMARRMHPTQAA